jgi:hypothetical protein
MATWNISGYSRTSERGIRHSVRDYTQNRRDAKVRVYRKKGYTSCQTDIAEVINRDLPINATVQVLRTESKWRHYVCGCKDSNLYDIATTGVAGKNSFFRNNPTVGASFTFIGGRGKTTVPGINKTIQGFYAHSKCGVDVFVPSYVRPYTGKQRVRLAAGG